MVDNGDSGYAETGGGWSDVDNPNLDPPFGDSARRHAGNGTATAEASWSFYDLEDGFHEVFVNWSPVNNNASNASYRIIVGCDSSADVDCNPGTGEKLVSTVVANQRTAPADDGKLAQSGPFPSRRRAFAGRANGRR